jgi:hypothetical protein
MLVDLTSMRFGLLVVIGRAPNGRNRAARWKVICDCGTECEAASYDLTSGVKRKCSPACQYRLPKFRAIFTETDHRGSVTHFGKA